MTELEQLKSENENLRQRLNLACALIDREDFMYVQNQNGLHVASISVTEKLKTKFFETVNV